MKFFFISLFLVFSYFDKIFIYSLYIYKIDDYFFIDLDSRTGIIDFNSNISYINFSNKSSILIENNNRSFLDGDLIIYELKKGVQISINNITVTQYNGYYDKNASIYRNDLITFLIGLGNGSEFFKENYTLNKINDKKYEILFDKPLDKKDNIVSINFKNNKINCEKINLIINTYSILNIETNITINLGKNNITFIELFYFWYSEYLYQILYSFDGNNSTYYINKNNFKSLDRIGFKINDSILYFSSFELFNILKDSNENYTISFKFNYDDFNFINLGMEFFSKFKIFNINYKENIIYLDSNSYFLNYSKYKNSFITIKKEDLNNITNEKSLPGNKYFPFIIICQIISLILIVISFIWIKKDDKNKSNKFI